jgi:acetate kinase
VKVLLLNAGSSSLKCSLLESADGSVLARVSIETQWRGRGDAARQALEELGVTRAPPAAVGHRIVHGGTFTMPVRITPEVRARIAELAELAPLHNPPGLETLAAAETLLPGVPQVAVFDTAFHATMPAAASTYPLPEQWLQWGIRRFGFHGLSHSYSMRRAAEMLARPADQLRLAICHLGHGCSATAVQDGRSVDTTMGFTPLDGLMMATRSGSIDPGIVTYVMQHRGLTAKDVDDALNHRAGLLGVSGVSSDMREVLEAAHGGSEPARLAVDVYVHHVRQTIGAFFATLGGLDVLVFTAGVGENSAEIRQAACRNLEHLGIELDAAANERCRPDADIACAGSRVRVLVIAAREDLEMLSETVRVIAA